MRAPEGYSVEREARMRWRGPGDRRRAARGGPIARDRARRAGRAQGGGLEVEDRIELALDGDDALKRAAQSHRDYVAGETLAVELQVGDGASVATGEDASVAAGERGYSEQVQIDGRALSIGLRRSNTGV